MSQTTPAQRTASPETPPCAGAAVPADRIAAPATYGGRTAREWLAPQRLVPYLAFLLLFGFFSLTRADLFLNQSNLLVILQQSVVLAIVAFGMTFVIVAGSIDLSVGSVVGLTGVVTAMVSLHHGWLGILAAVGVGAVAGLVNGIAFAYGKIPSFIVTLGMLQVARGLTLQLSEGSAQSLPMSGLVNQIGVMPWILVDFAVMTVLAALLFRVSLFGRRVRAIGGNERVARLAGVPTTRIKVLVFVLSGVLAGLGGAILASRLGTGSPTAGTGFELDVIAAVVIGGTPLTGGLGRISGTVLGAVIISMLSNGLVLLSVGDAAQLIIKGVILAVAVFVSLERGKIGTIK